MNTPATGQDNRSANTCQSVSALLWPSFLAAGLATVILFTFINPADIAASLGKENVTNLGAYSTGFFILWALCALSSFGTQYFSKPCDSINKNLKQ